VWGLAVNRPTFLTHPPTGPTAAGPTAAGRAAAARRRGRRTLGALLTLAVGSTAGAPSFITIRPGDTLWDLARTHGTSVAALKQLNALPGNGMIYAGDTLRLHGSSPAVASGGQRSGTRGERSHVVRGGDTLGGLALTYGVRPGAIANAPSCRAAPLPSVNVSRCPVPSPAAVPPQPPPPTPARASPSECVDQ